jgi:hypothetical protein
LRVALQFLQLVRMFEERQRAAGDKVDGGLVSGNE